MEENSSQSNKYDAALAKYNTNLSDADIQARVADLIERKCRKTIRKKSRNSCSTAST